MITWQQALFGYNKDTLFGQLNLSRGISLGLSHSAYPLFHNPFLLPLFTVAVSIIFLVLALYLLIKLALTIKQIRSPFSLLEIKPIETQQSSYSTQQLFILLHSLAKQRSLLYRLVGVSKKYGLEIISSKDQGIRYLIRVPKDDTELITKNLLSYLPGMKIKDVEDYASTIQTRRYKKISEFRLAHHFSLPLKTQNALDKYDPIAYITGNMTKLNANELVSLQMVVAPVNKNKVSDIEKVSKLIYTNKDLVSSLKALKKQGTLFYSIFSLLLHILLFPVGLLVFLTSEGRDGPFLNMNSNSAMDKTLNAYQTELETKVKEKLDQQLFYVTIRILVSGDDAESSKKIERGFASTLSSFTNSGYQSLSTRFAVGIKPYLALKQFEFKNRLFGVRKPDILSVSEVTDMYHFPYTGTTKTENLVTVMSRELPAPLSLKSQKKLDVIFGKNTYGNTVTDIGLMDDDRTRHVYSIGQTGSGKSTIIFHMASQDIAKNRGVAVLDPHGDLSKDILASMSLERINDLIYFNPFDIKYPVGINLLELAPCRDDDELELEKELVCESVISIFRRIFSKDETVDAHRIEYILRNTIYTAFTVKDATIFTVYNLLTDPDVLKNVLTTLEDENLQNFWKNEFGKAGNYQVVKMVSGVTARIGRFLFSPIAKRILEQKHSTINFDDILDSGKVLLCNLNEGNLGEDTSTLLGTTILAKIQQAAMRRSRINVEERKPFYLFVDEFQNFASSYFTKMLSGGRKFGLRIFIAEQSTAQQSDRSIVNVILANTGNVIGFHMAGPVDEELLSAQFSPYVEKRELANLARYHFYMKMSANIPEEPFSGTTLPITVVRDPEKMDTLIAASRKNYAIVYQKPMKTKIMTHIKPAEQQSETTKKMPASKTKSVATLV